VRAIAAPRLSYACNISCTRLCTARSGSGCTLTAGVRRAARSASPRLFVLGGRRSGLIRNDANSTDQENDKCRHATLAEIKANGGAPRHFAVSDGRSAKTKPKTKRKSKRKFKRRPPAKLCLRNDPHRSIVSEE
jgi:hypothetical protein